MDVEELLRLLDEPKIQEKLKLLLSAINDQTDCPTQLNENQELNQKVICLENENQIIKKENSEMIERIKQFLTQISGNDKNISDKVVHIDKFNEQISTLTQLINDKDVKLNLKIKEVVTIKELLDISEKKVNYYRDNFSEDIRLQEIYSDLSEVSRSSLSGIFKSTTPKGLIACGVQEKNIGNLWEYAKNEVINDNNPDIATIIRLFDALFNRFTLAFPMYELQVVKPGDVFDTQLHIKHHSSYHVSGTIASILLRGYVNTKTGKIIKESIVKI